MTNEENESTTLIRRENDDSLKALRVMGKVGLFIVAAGGTTTVFYVVSVQVAQKIFLELLKVKNPQAWQLSGELIYLTAMVPLVAQSFYLVVIDSAEELKKFFSEKDKISYIKDIDVTKVLWRSGQLVFSVASAFSFVGALQSAGKDGAPVLPFMQYISVPIMAAPAALFLFNIFTIPAIKDAYKRTSYYLRRLLAGEKDGALNEELVPRDLAISLLMSLAKQVLPKLKEKELIEMSQAIADFNRQHLLADVADRQLFFLTYLLHHHEHYLDSKLRTFANVLFVFLGFLSTASDIANSSQLHAAWMRYTAMSGSAVASNVIHMVSAAGIVKAFDACFRVDENDRRGKILLGVKYTVALVPSVVLGIFIAVLTIINGQFPFKMPIAICSGVANAAQGLKGITDLLNWEGVCYQFSSQRILDSAVQHILEGDFRDFYEMLCRRHQNAVRYFLREQYFPKQFLQPISKGASSLGMLSRATVEEIQSLHNSSRLRPHFSALRRSQ